MKRISSFASLIISLSAPALATMPLPVCRSVQLVEYRNSILAAHLLCPSILTNDDYNQFIIKNRRAIARANGQAVSFYVHRDHCRTKFDRLDSITMNEVALRASKDISFCEMVESYKPYLRQAPIDALLLAQNPFALAECN